MSNGGSGSGNSPLSHSPTPPWTVGPPTSGSHPRRPSYATVAAGSLNSSRFNTLAAATASSPIAIPQTEEQHHHHITRQPSRGSLVGMDIDSVGGSLGAGSAGAGLASGSSRKRPGSSWSMGEAVAGMRNSDVRLGCNQHDDHPPFFTPSYLRRSRYVQRLHQRWDAHIAELREKLLAHGDARSSTQSVGLSASASSSQVNLGKLPGSASQRSVVQDVIERNPPPTSNGADERLIGLPSRWNESDAQAGLEIIAEGSEVRFNGVTKSSEEAASVRTDFPMPRQCGIFYFEVTILSRSKDGVVGVGFSTRKANLSRLPGWQPESWAIHGDDGYCFSGSEAGKAYGPRFSANDVIGCGVNFCAGEVFFTKNGVHLGVAFSGIKTEGLYPSVGLKKPGEHLRINFGRQSFSFDIDGLVASERASAMASIAAASASHLHPPDDETSLVQRLVGQYLAHEGYVETARAFARGVKDERSSLAALPRAGDNDRHNLSPLLPDADDDINALNRQKIRRAILDGDIDRALKFINAFYPHVFDEERNRDIYFRLRCRKFVEMMRRFAELQSSSAGLALPAAAAQPTSNGHVDPISAQLTGGEEANGRPDTQMELDEQLQREAATQLHDSTDGDAAAMTRDDALGLDVEMDLTVADDASTTTDKQGDLLSAALECGQQLRREFGTDPRPHVRKQLQDVFAIMAYVDPAASVVGAQLDPRGRVAIAEEVNGAILVSLGKPPSAALEKLCAQTEWLLDQAAAKRGDASALVNVGDDFLRP